jgi:hypothetical protein
MKRQESQESRAAQHQKFKDTAAALDCTNSEDSFVADLSRIIRCPTEGHSTARLADSQDVGRRSGA